MQASPLGMALLTICVAFALAGFLFVSLSWIVACAVIVTLMVYAHERFARELSSSKVIVVHRVLDKMAFAYEPVSVRIDISNTDDTPLHAVFEDIPPADSIPGAGSAKLDATVPPLSTSTFTYSFIPQKRGAHMVGRLKIERTDHFGVFTHTRYYEDIQQLNVHTRRDSFDTARRIAGREHFEYAGMSRTPAVVLREFEFEGLREHVAGDRSRDIHWKSLAKTGKLMTKIYKKEGTLRTMVFVDCSRSMRLSKGGLPKLDHAVDLALQLSNVLISSFHPAGVAAYDEVTVTGQVRPALGKHQFERITKALRSIPGAIVTDQGQASTVIKDSEERTEEQDQEEEEAASAFLEVLKAVRRAGDRGPAGLGLEEVAKDMIAHSRGQELLFIVVSDLVSARDSVLSTARLCQRTGNRLLVIQTYDDWYSSPDRVLDMAEGERLYSGLTEGVKVEAALRRAGASFLRIGPADTTARIVRSVRRGIA